MKSDKLFKEYFKRKSASSKKPVPVKALKKIAGEIKGESKKANKFSLFFRRFALGAMMAVSLLSVALTGFNEKPLAREFVRIYKLYNLKEEIPQGIEYLSDAFKQSL